ncbi:hypothetical protein BMF94_1610 [Rhodotorula taiwanensis]|uniref:Uncharacterized protein n=1 Tax=Rhodotorula taiwanensis TaxID=741276 RepID=A0A2S5BEQ3_9BASI|nr:hypothetical protein BMF94_1610 [Rhodotorula taiwanensis]
MQHHLSRASPPDDDAPIEDGPFAPFRAAFARASHSGYPTTWSETYRLAANIYSTSLQGFPHDRGSRAYADTWGKKFLRAFQATYLDVVVPLFGKGPELVAYLDAFAHDLETMPPAHRLDYLSAWFQQVVDPMRLQRQLGLPSFTLNSDDVSPHLAWEELRQVLVDIIKAAIGSKGHDLRAPKPGRSARGRYDRLMTKWRPDVEQTFLPFLGQPAYAGLSQALLRAYKSLLRAVIGLTAHSNYNAAERLLLSWPGKDVLKYVVRTRAVLSAWARR